MAPELLRITESKPCRPTKESDIYAFAMVTIEVRLTILLQLHSAGAHKPLNVERQRIP